MCIYIYMQVWCNLYVLNGAVHFTHQRPHVHVLVNEVALGHIPLRARRFAPFSCRATDAPYWCYFICHRYCMVTILATTLNAPVFHSEQFKQLVVTLCTTKFNIKSFYVLSTQCIYFVRISEQTAIIYVCSINWLDFRSVRKIAESDS